MPKIGPCHSSELMEFVRDCQEAKLLFTRHIIQENIEQLTDRAVNEDFIEFLGDVLGSASDSSEYWVKHLTAEYRIQVRMKGGSAMTDEAHRVELTAHEGDPSVHVSAEITPAPAAQPAPLSFAPKTPVRAEHVYHCSRDGNVAGTIRLHDGDRDDEMKLVIDSFVCEQVCHIPSSVAERVRELLRQGDIQSLYRIDAEYAPFYCPRCDAVYCGACWRQSVVFADDYPGWFEESRGECPAGHERRLID